MQSKNIEKHNSYYQLKLSAEAVPFKPTKSPPPDDVNVHSTKCMEIGCNKERKQRILSETFAVTVTTTNELIATEYYCVDHAKCEVKNCSRSREMNVSQCAYHQVCGIAGCSEIPVVFSDFSVCPKHIYSHRCKIGMCGISNTFATGDDRLFRCYFPTGRICDTHVHLGKSIYYRIFIMKMINLKKSPDP